MRDPDFLSQLTRAFIAGCCASIIVLLIYLHADLVALNRNLVVIAEGRW